MNRAAGTETRFGSGTHQMIAPEPGPDNRPSPRPCAVACDHHGGSGNRKPSING